MCAFGYKLPDYFMEYGPLYATDLGQAKVLIRQLLNTKRLPGGIQIWNLESRPLKRWRISQAS